MKKVASSFDLLNSSIQHWIWSQGWTSLNEVQEKSIPVILKRNSDVVISAATAGGKTEAAFLPILSSIVKETEKGCKVLYISPLKSLINDQYRRLLDLTRATKTNVTPWHQDISISLKQRFLDSPTDILIITPESLESFLINRRGAAELIFPSLKYIVIDELHAFIGTERGKQLQSLLSRIEIISAREIPRIAMSATFSDFENVIKYINGNRLLKCNVIEQKQSSHEVRILLKEYIGHNSKVDDKISNEILNKLRGTNNLVFVNSKKDAETYTEKLIRLCETYSLPNEFRIHHGNLSKEVREGVEHELQAGSYPITAICTSTMELGVDIGKVKSIAQIGKAYSVSSLRQRLGRSGRRNEPSYLRIFSVDFGDGLLWELRESLFQNIAVVELLKEKKYETEESDKLHLSTLIHQLISLIVSYGSITPQEAWTVLCVKGEFTNVDSIIFGKILRVLGEKKVLSQMSSLEIVLGTAGEEIVSKQDFYSVFNSNENFTVIDTANNRIGIVQDIPRVGDVIILGAKNWTVENVDKKRHAIYVKHTNKKGNFIFGGCGLELSSLIINKMKKIYSSTEIYKYLDSIAIKEFRKGKDFFQKYYLDKVSFIKYNDINVMFTWGGSVINNTIALIARYNLNKEVCQESPIYLYDITKSEIEEILKVGKPTSIELASMLERDIKCYNKYDYLLSEELLNITYARSYIDIESAWDFLLNIVK